MAIRRLLRNHNTELLRVFNLQATWKSSSIFFFFFFFFFFLLPSVSDGGDKTPLAEP